jgi:hypothetical protein
VRDVLRYDSQADPLSWAGRQNVQALVSVAVALDAQGENVTAEYRITDVLSGKVHREGIIQGPKPYGYELTETFWIPLLTDFDSYVPTERRNHITIEAAPGTRVTGFTDEALSIGKSGSVRLPTFIPGMYSWRATRNGLVTQSGVFAALENEAVLAIPSVPLNPWALEVGLFMGQFADLWVNRGFFQNYAFLRAGISQYLMGLYLPELYGQGEPRNLLVSYPMVMPGIGAGVHFLGEEAFIRPYISLSYALRYNLALSSLDPAGPYAGTAFFGFHWLPSGKASYFFEFGLTVYPQSRGALMSASNRGNKTLTWYDDGFYGEFPNFRLGARFRL